MSLRKLIANKLMLLGILVALLTSGSMVITSQQAHALSGSEFQAGRIIDDAVFFDRGDMTVAQIQQFLNAKVPVCDTNGTQPYGNTTRAAYGTSNGVPPPYVCLKDYRYDTPNRAAETGLCNSYTGRNQSAAEIIYDVAQSCGVNSKVLLVLLQKEQTLITDDWPWPGQYRSATGYGCPDTAPCDAQYYGYFNQVYMAARQYKRYALNANDYNYVAGRNNTIQYNPSTSCGSSTVYVHNQATAGLYNYTPYQPNSAALNNLYGLGNGCSSYGNRNFWRMYSDWFGSTQRFNGNITLSQGLTSTATGTVQTGETVTASYQVSNSADYATLAGGLGICARLNGEFYDFGYADQTNIPAKSTVTVSYSKTIDRPGSLYLFVCSYHASLGGWTNPFYPYSSTNARTLSLNVAANPLITSGVTFSPANASIGQPVTATMAIRNAGNADVNVGAVVMAARDPYGNNVDFPADTSLTIPAKTTVTYSKTRTFATPGDYSFFIANFRNNTWNRSYPSSADGSVMRQGTLRILDNPLITSGVTFSPASPAAGQTATASMTMRNTSGNPVNIGLIVVAARDPYGNNVDFPADTNVTIPANGTYTYTKSRTFTTPGSHSFFIANFRNNTWDRNYPKSIDNAVIRQGTLPVKDNPLITTGMSISPASPTAGQTVTATMSIHNASDSPVAIGLILVAARDPQGNNVDFPADTNVTIPANSTYTYSKTRVFSITGDYSLFIANFNNNAWNRDYPKSADNSVVRQRTLRIN